MDTIFSDNKFSSFILKSRFPTVFPSDITRFGRSEWAGFGGVTVMLGITCELIVQIGMFRNEIEWDNMMTIWCVFGSHFIEKYACLCL